MKLVSPRQQRDRCRTIASDQPNAQHQRGEPNEPGEADAAEHRGRAVIFDAADGHMVLGGDVVGKLFDRGVEEFDRQQAEKGGDHRDVPGNGRRNDEAQKEAGDQKDHFLAERSLAAEAVADGPQRIDGRAENPFHD